MQPEDAKEKPSPASIKSGSSTIPGTNGHSSPPDSFDGPDTFAFGVYSQVPFDDRENELRWEEVPSEAQGTATRDPVTGDIRYEWIAPAADYTGKVEEGLFVKHSQTDRWSKLRKQTTADGEQSRWVQTYYERASERPNKKPYRLIADQMLVGHWFNNPASSVINKLSSAGMDDDFTVADDGWTMLNGPDQWVELPGHRSQVVLETAK